MKALIRLLLIAAIAYSAGTPIWAATTYRGPLPYTPFALTDGSTIAVDGTQSETFTLTITGTAHTISNPTSLIAGARLVFIITQNATGGFIPLWDTEYVFPYGPATYNSGANAVSIVSCVASSTTALLCANTATSGVTNVFTANTIAPTANYLRVNSISTNNLLIQNTSFRAQLLKSLH